MIRLIPSILSTLIFMPSQVMSVDMTSLTSKTLLTSCVDPSGELPNLSYANRIVSAQVPSNGLACEAPLNTTLGVLTAPPGNAIFTWYYYNNASDTTCDGQAQCCHQTTTSTLQTTVFTYRTVGGLTVGTATGSVISGAYAGKNVTMLTTSVPLNALNCYSQTGIEAKTGEFELLIIGGPTCKGVITQEFCPGLKSPPLPITTEGLLQLQLLLNLTISLPLPPITLPPITLPPLFGR